VTARMAHRVPTPEQALRFIEETGVVLESARGRVPTFVDFVAGEPVTRWWGHPLGRSIFRLTRVVRDSPDILICNLVDHRVTYVHKRVWPALVRLSDRFDKRDLAWIREEHLPSGKHRLMKTSYPQWVPAEVIERSKMLSEQDAVSLLGFDPIE